MALAPLAHPHIVGFKGMLLRFPSAGGSSSDFELGLVFELCDGGNLHARMFAGSGHLLTYDDRLRIAREIAQAMAYVHGISIIHRDLRSGPPPRALGRPRAAAAAAAAIAAASLLLRQPFFLSAPSELVP
jgi:serine/threonine protein kinase